MLFFFAFAVLIVPCTAFVPVSSRGRAISSLFMSNPIEDLLQSILKVFPEVLSAPKEMDPAKINRNLPRYTKSGTIKKWRKAHRYNNFLILICYIFNSHTSAAHSVAFTRIFFSSCAPCKGGECLEIARYNRRFLGNLSAIQATSRFQEETIQFTN